MVLNGGIRTNRNELLTRLQQLEEHYQEQLEVVQWDDLSRSLYEFYQWEAVAPDEEINSYLETLAEDGIYLTLEKVRNDAWNNVSRTTRQEMIKSGFIPEYPRK